MPRELALGGGAGGQGRDGRLEALEALAHQPLGLGIEVAQLDRGVRNQAAAAEAVAGDLLAHRAQQLDQHRPRRAWRLGVARDQRGPAPAIKLEHHREHLGLAAEGG